MKERPSSKPAQSNKIDLETYWIQTKCNMDYLWPAVQRSYFVTCWTRMFVILRESHLAKPRRKKLPAKLRFKNGFQVGLGVPVE